MPRHAACIRSGSAWTSLYDEINNKIIAELEADRVSWLPTGPAILDALMARLPLVSTADKAAA